MNRWRNLVVGVMLAGQLSVAQASSCSAIEARKDLPAEVKIRLLKGCRQSEASTSCEAQAKTKRLTGREKDKFIQQCFRGR